MLRAATKTKHILGLSLIAVVLSTTAMAEKPVAGGGVIVASEPGKAVVVEAAKISAQVTGIDKETRTVTLKGPKGDVVDVVAGEEVKNFDQINLGDIVVVRYTEALTLELKKNVSGSGDVTVVEKAERAKSGDRPAMAGGRQVSVLTEVVAVDPEASTITIKGPKGKEVTLNVQNPEQFKVVKRGDHVEVTYTEALALSVEPAVKE